MSRSCWKKSTLSTGRLIIIYTKSKCCGDSTSRSGRIIRSELAPLHSITMLVLRLQLHLFILYILEHELVYRDMLHGFCVCLKVTVFTLLCDLGTTSWVATSEIWPGKWETWMRKMDSELSALSECWTNCQFLSSFLLIWQHFCQSTHSNYSLFYIVYWSLLHLQSCTENRIF